MEGREERASINETVCKEQGVSREGREGRKGGREKKRSLGVSY